jgi:hypothetical protein
MNNLSLSVFNFGLNALNIRCNMIVKWGWCIPLCACTRTKFNRKMENITIGNPTKIGLVLARV